MSELQVQNVSMPLFSASAISSEGVIELLLSGSADLESRDEFRSFVDEVHKEAGRLQPELVSISLKGLEFMNSSSFKVLITWISRVKALDAPRRYRLRFVSDPTIYWQNRSLHALKCFATDIIELA